MAAVAAAAAATVGRREAAEGPEDRLAGVAAELLAVDGSAAVEMRAAAGWEVVGSATVVREVGWAAVGSVASTASVARAAAVTAAEGLVALP